MQLKKIARIGPTNYFLRPDGIVYTESESPSPLTVEIMIENFEFIKQLALKKGAAIRMLTDFNAAQKVDKECRAYIKSPESHAYNDYIVGTALLSERAIARMLGNFILGLRGTGKEDKQYVKLFQSEEKAAQWLLQLPDKPLIPQQDETN